MKIDTRKIVTGGLLIATTLVLAATPAGLIPIPGSPAGNMATVHVPVIIGALTLGPLMGSLLGLIFAGFTLFLPVVMALYATFGWKVVVVLVVPRLLIGPVAWLTYRALSRWPDVATSWAAIAGTLTNTVGVLGLAVAFGIFKWPVALSIAGINGSIEVALAVAIVTPVVAAVRRAVGIPSKAPAKAPDLVAEKG